MRIYSLLLFIFLFCGFSSYHLSFEVVNKSSKDFASQDGKNEFHFLGNPVDTTKSIFIAAVKVKGENVTIVNMYAKLRKESQKLGANSFQVLNHVKDNDNYYLLCNIYLTDTATLLERKKNDIDNGKIHIICSEPVGYLNKDKVTINDSLKITLLSGTYHTVSIGKENQKYKILSRGSKIEFTGNKNQVKYITTRKAKYNISQTVSYFTSSGQKLSALANKKIKENILENALGKLMLLFYKSV